MVLSALRDKVDEDDKVRLRKTPISYADTLFLTKLMKETG